MESGDAGVDDASQSDADFQRLLGDIHIHSISLADPADKQRCIAWVDRLKHLQGSLLKSQRILRNQYACLLLDMCKGGIIAGPFNSDPEPGPLPQLPSYWYSHLAMLPRLKMNSMQVQSRLPTKTSLSTGLIPESKVVSLETARKELFKDSPSKMDETRNSTLTSLEKSFESINPSAFPLNTPLKEADEQFMKELDLSQVSLSAAHRRLSSTLNDEGFISPHRYRELEHLIRTRIAAQFNEERLTLQHKYENDLQKLLQLKNRELESYKSAHQAQISEQQRTIQALREKLEAVRKQLSEQEHGRESHEEYISSRIDNLKLSLRSQYINKLKDAEHRFAEERASLEAKISLTSTEQMQTLETEVRNLREMSEQVGGQLLIKTEKVEELEQELKMVCKEVDELTSEKNDAVEDAKRCHSKINQLASELAEKQNSYEKDLEELRKKLAHSDQLVVQLESQLAQTQRDTDSATESLRDSLHAAKKEYQQIMEQQLNMSQQEISLKAQVQELESKLASVTEASETRIADLQQLINEKDNVIVKLEQTSQQGAAQAQKVFEEYRHRSAESNALLMTEVNSQMKKIEEDLISSRQLQEAQTDEFHAQLKDLREYYEMQLQQRHLQHGKDLQRLQLERDALEEGRASDALKWEKQHSADKQAIEEKTRAIADLTSQVDQLKERLRHADKTRKHQLVKLQEAHEADKRHHYTEKEALVSKFRKELESLEQCHQESLNTSISDVTNRWRHMEDEYESKTREVKALLAKYLGERNTLAEEKQRLEWRLKETADQFVKELEAMKKKKAIEVASIREELDNVRLQLSKTLQEKQQAEKNQNERLKLIKWEYEKRLQLMLPMEIQREYEDTISALQSQVRILESRCSLLHDSTSMSLLQREETESERNKSLLSVSHLVQ